MTFAGSRWRRSPVLLVTALLALDAALSMDRTSAHEVPAEIEVIAYVRPVAGRVHLLLRVPLSGLLNSKLPKEGPGYLALAYVTPALRETALALADAIDLYQGETRLGPPSVMATRISLPLD